MKSFAIAALAGVTVAQGWLPSCSWNDCMGSWDGASCDQSSGWDCICSNSTAISQINTCVATSCTNATDQETIYGAIAQLCANAGAAVTNSQQATFSATSGGSLLPSATGGWGPGGDWDSASWSSWASQVSTAIGSAPSGWGPGSSWGNNWGGPGGHGGHGPGGNGGNGGWGGPWGTKADGIACSGTASWTTWTAGWGPFSSWTGQWSGCSSTTATPEPATVTTTVNGSVITGTTFGIQALSTESGAGSASGSAAAGSTASLIDTAKVVTFSGLVAGSMFALMVVL
ncbi:hypothetical protein PMZ80_006075 [Knufia obscura]|uniref:CFEM domain-containing protein n=2 Tax=Knufia TaxID=430999 RepID=A0AAN8EIG2_9EURO|nr:hypothetical protein PMZ80_006075 [Knufia obscura]KAK5954745.1 hypothetical protein OHC33_004469 [Knufia fluminis]